MDAAGIEWARQLPRLQLIDGDIIRERLKHLRSRVLLDALTWGLTAAIAILVGAAVGAHSGHLAPSDEAWLVVATLSGSAAIGAYVCRRAGRREQVCMPDVQRLHDPEAPRSFTDEPEHPGDSAGRNDSLQHLWLELEAKVAERTAELARRETLYRRIADLSPQIIWQADAEGRTTYLNRAWYSLVGPRPDGWLGTRWFEALHPGDVDAARRELVRAVGDGDTFCMRYRLRSRCGGYRNFLAGGAPVRGEDGAVDCWVGVSTDITDMEAQQERLQHLNEELEAFSSTVSHDLRAPVQVISGFVDALLRGEVGQVDAQARGYLERIHRNARRMDELIADLLALSRLSTSTPRHRHFDLGELAGEVSQAVQERYPQRRIQWRAPQEFWMVADRPLVQAMLENLVDNAVKYSPQEDVCEVDIRAVRSLDRVVLTVADRGVGFRADQAHRLFRPFQRLHGDEEFRGTGIGLATVARIARLHGGSVRGRVRQGGGSVFQVRLPLLRVDGPEREELQ